MSGNCCSKEIDIQNRSIISACLEFLESMKNHSSCPNKYESSLKHLHQVWRVWPGKLWENITWGRNQFVIKSYQTGFIKQTCLISLDIWTLENEILFESVLYWSQIQWNTWIMNTNVREFNYESKKMIMI